MPRGELQALVVMHRLLLTVAEAFPGSFLSVSAYTDSACCLGALGKTRTTMKPFFAHRVSEIAWLREQLQGFAEEVDEVQHIPGVDNPADVGTRGLGCMDQLGPESVWQCGPAFLSGPFEDWPKMTQEVASTIQVPIVKCRIDSGTSLTAQVEEVDGDIATTLKQATMEDSSLGLRIRTMAQETLSREKLEKSLRALARILCGVVGGSHDLIKTPPQKKWVELAVQLVLRCGSRLARNALEQKKTSWDWR